MLVSSIFFFILRIWPHVGVHIHHFIHAKAKKVGYLDLPSLPIIEQERKKESRKYWDLYSVCGYFGMIKYSVYQKQK